MPIVKVLSDTASHKDRILQSVVLGKPITAALKNILTKTNFKTGDLWTVADQKAAGKTTDPKTLMLDKKMDTKKSWDAHGVEDKFFIYVKKKGAPPNTPAPPKAASPKVEPPKPTPTPTPAPPPAPTPPAPEPPAPTPPAEPPVKQPPPPPTPAAPVPPPAEPSVKSPPPAPTPAPAAPAPPTPAPPTPVPVPSPVPVAPAPKQELPTSASVQSVASPKSPEIAPLKVKAPPTPSRISDAKESSDVGGSAVAAFVEELSGLGSVKGSQGVLGALISELSTKGTGEREYLRGLGQERSRSPITRWAGRNTQSSAANGMLEVSGLIDYIEKGFGRKSKRQDAAFRPVQDLLERIGLEKYEGLFEEADFDLESLLNITEKELVEVGVTALGARKRIMAEVEKTKMQQNQQKPQHEPQQLRYAEQHQEYQEQYPPVLHNYDERAARREQDLEKRWMEVAQMDGHNDPEWDRRWEAARAQDYHESSRWQGRSSRSSSPPPASRHALLMQRLDEIQNTETAAYKPRLPSHWQIFYTAQGTPYYYNSVTNTTQWTLPARSQSPLGRRASPHNRNRSPYQYRRYQPAY